MAQIVWGLRIISAVSMGLILWAGYGRSNEYLEQHDGQFMGYHWLSDSAGQRIHAADEADEKLLSQLKSDGRVIEVASLLGVDSVRATMGLVGVSGQIIDRILGWKQGEYFRAEAWYRPQADDIILLPASANRVSSLNHWRASVWHEFAHAAQARYPEEMRDFWEGVPPIMDSTVYGYDAPLEQQAEALRQAFVLAYAGRDGGSDMVTAIGEREQLVPGTKKMLGAILSEKAFSSLRKKRWAHGLPRVTAPWHGAGRRTPPLNMVSRLRGMWMIADLPSASDVQQPSGYAEVPWRKSKKK